MYDIMICNGSYKATQTIIDVRTSSGLFTHKILHTEKVGAFGFNLGRSTDLHLRCEKGH